MVTNQKTAKPTITQRIASKISLRSISPRLLEQLYAFASSPEKPKGGAWERPPLASNRKRRSALFGPIQLVAAAAVLGDVGEGRLEGVEVFHACLGSLGV